MRKYILVLFFTIFSLYSFCQQGNKNAETEILNVLHTQQEYWNKGDLVQFMDGYWHNDSLVFIGSKGPSYGWENALKSYQNAYSNKAEMGQLEFSDIRLKPIDTTHYLVIGKWALQRVNDHPNGYYSLIFQYIDKKWKIILDHSS